jgi:membrane-associated phospholipid phosphatase
MGMKRLLNRHYLNERAWLENYEFSWARLVSDVLSPPVVLAVLSFPLASQIAANNNEALVYALIYTFFSCIVPVLFIAYMVKRGKITDIHIKVRRQRIIPLMVTILSGLVGLALLIILNAPRLMILFTLFGLLQIGVMMIITLFWQISLHGMGITSAVVALGALFGPLVGIVFSPLIVLVGAARVVLKRHTIAQVIGGGLVGGAMTSLMFLLAR